MTATPKATNRFVAMFDIIGFKNLRKELGTDGLYQKWVRGILPAIQHSAAGRRKTEIRDGRPVQVPDFNARSVSYRSISDTVILFTRDNSAESFVDIVNACAGLLPWSMNGIKAPFRGALGYGDLIEAEETVLLGSAVEDAYVGEGSQVWAGAMLTQSCEMFARGAGYFDAVGRRLVQYSVPIQTKSDTGPTAYSRRDAYVIDWTHNIYDGASERAFFESENDHANRIRNNTIAFEQWARANNRD